MKAQELKNSILQYAMQGKLVPQNPNDEPANVLLGLIKEEKEKLIKDKVIKSEKALPAIADNERPFEIPDTWEWVRIGEISIVGTGSTPPKDNPDYYQNGTVPWVNSSLTSNLFISQTNSYITELAVKERNLNLYKRGSLVVALYGQGKTRGQVSELLIDATVNQACAVITEVNSLLQINPFLKVFFQKTYHDIRTLASGGAQPNLNVQKIKNYPVPLPPLAEQKRIVAKIEELFEKVNRYDVLEQEITALNNSFPTNMEKSILQYAMQGKLVEQDSNEEPASVLLGKIREEKEQLIKDKVIKREKALPPIVDDEIPFEIPNSWEWVRLGDIGISNIGLTYKPSDVVEKGIPVLRSNNIQNDKICYNDLINVNVELSGKLITKRGDLLICARNGSKRLVGKAALIDRDGMSFGAFMSIYRSRCNEYIHKFFISPILRDQLTKSGTTTINQITQKMLKEFIVPLPPLAEQKRIVDKIEEFNELTIRMKNSMNIN